MSEITKFQEIISVFAALQNIMSNDLIVAKRYIHDKDLLYSMHQKMIIDICSFRKEWPRLNSIAKDRQDIQGTLSVASPAVKIFKKWSGLEGMRNTMLAHGFRDEATDKKPTSLKSRFFEADVPRNYAEIMLLSEACVIAGGIVIHRHREEYDNYIQEPIDEKYLHDTSKGIASAQELNTSIQKLREEILVRDPGLITMLGNFRI